MGKRFIEEDLEVAILDISSVIATIDAIATERYTWGTHVSRAALRFYVEKINGDVPRKPFHGLEVTIHMLMEEAYQEAFGLLLPNLVDKEHLECLSSGLSIQRMQLHRNLALIFFNKIRRIE